MPPPTDWRSLAGRRMKREPKSTVLLDVEPHSQPRLAVERDDTPFRILVLADLGGRADPRPHRIDRDDYDDVLHRIGPRAALSLSDAGTPVVVDFTDIDDFHPDHLRATLPLFASLRDLRDRLDDPATFERAARELLGDTREAGPASESPVADRPAGTRELDSGAPVAPPKFRTGSLLDMMVDDADAGARSEAQGLPAPPPRDDLQGYIRSLIAPHIVPGEDPRKEALVERIDQSVGDVMRRVLHDPAFRAVESAWRALFTMVRRITTGPELTIDVVDLPRARLEADLAADRTDETTALYRLLVEHSAGTEGGTPWSVVIGDYTFGPDPADAALLGRIAAIARQAGVSFIAGAHPSLAGCPGFADMPDPAQWAAAGSAEWDALRRSADARHAGLVLPRYLQRLPYGEGAEECDTFEFEELADPADHDGYLWGNGSYICAMLLAESFSEVGWAMKPGMHRDVGGLPLHLARVGPETIAKPCAETLMTERAAARLAECGLMPLASMKHGDVVRMVSFQSIADPKQPFAGRWRR